jgi:hypothetical protein
MRLPDAAVSGEFSPDRWAVLALPANAASSHFAGIHHAIVP